MPSSFDFLEVRKASGTGARWNPRSGVPSTVMRTKGADLAELAACYAFGIARNHAFVDGNKRTAFLAVVTFLGLNGVEFVVDDASAVATFRDLAAGALTEDGLSRWVRDNWPAGTPLDMG